LSKANHRRPPPRQGIIIGRHRGLTYRGGLFYGAAVTRAPVEFDRAPISTGSHEVQDMAKPKLKQHHINRDWCKGCGICVELCPKKVLELDEQDKVTVVRPQDCICCRLCELRCPDFAIEVETQE
jgi:2-oxoglutarate ferredoxin oxidoreductase subunit delta